MKRIILLSLHLLIFFNIIFCQDVVEQIKKYNITTLEKKAINKTRKQLKIEKDKNLHVITIFTVTKSGEQQSHIICALIHRHLVSKEL